MEKKPTPFGNRVLVKVNEPKKELGFGLIIPDAVLEKPQRAIVVAAGSGTKDEPMEVKEGDDILFTKGRGLELEIEGGKVLLLSMKDILLKL